MSEIQEAPTTFNGIRKQLGPGLIISANIVGSGELIVTTKLGADVGFIMLWFIILGCLLKVFVQLELGPLRDIQEEDDLGSTEHCPRSEAGGLVASLDLDVDVCCDLFQLSGMVGGLAQVFNLAGSDLSHTVLAILITGLLRHLAICGALQVHPELLLDHDRLVHGVHDLRRLFPLLDPVRSYRKSNR